MSKINDINDLVNATFQVKKFFRDTKKKFNLNYEEIYIFITRIWLNTFISYNNLMFKIFCQIENY